MRTKYRQSELRFWHRVITKSTLRRLSVGLSVIGFVCFTNAQLVLAAPAGYDNEHITEIRTDTGFNDPDAICGQNDDTSGGSSSGTSGESITADSIKAAEDLAKADNTGTQKVGFALYDSTGKKANYNEFAENYGASITKSLILVAYLNQVGAGTLSGTANTEVTGMIEQSDNADADAVFHLLSDPETEIKAVASQAGMGGLQYNATADPVYVLGQSMISADGFAKFFSVIISLIKDPAKQTLAKTLLSTITPQEGLLKAGLPGTVYSKEGWKPEPSGTADAPYVVNQAGQFTIGSTTYGVAVTVGGTQTEDSGAGVVEAIVKALLANSNSSTSSQEQGGGCSCDATPSLTGNDNEQKIWNYLIGLGLSPVQVAGIMGNLEQESSFDPQRVQGGGDSTDPSAAGSGGYGLAQWSPGSKIIPDLQQAKIGGSPSALATQLQLIAYEMKNTSPKGVSNTFGGIKKITDVDQAATYFDTNFEGGTDPSGVREKDAEAILKAYSSSSNSGSSDSETNCTSSASSPNCAGANGVAKILCDAERYDPASYEESARGNHFGGGNPEWIKEICPAAGNPTAKIPTSCLLDCSGLVNIAVYDAFGYNLEENTDGEVAAAQPSAKPQLWKEIPFNQIQPGDLIQPAEEAGGHVEIVDHVLKNQIYTFGAHQSGVPQPQQVGPASFPHESGDVFLHWIGPTT
jgi:hypothetical protein